jgi:hypothetical protein
VEETPQGQSELDDLEVPAVSPRGGPAEASTVELPPHPKGTLALVLIYGALFLIGWAWVYFGEFLARGAPTG